jgi:hypothetical protein
MSTPPIKPRPPRNLQADLEKAGTVIPSIADITTIEMLYENNRWPSLGFALDLLRLRWLVGEKDEETGIRLLFLLWHATCAQDAGCPKPGEFEQVFVDMGGEHSNNPLLLKTVGQMTKLFPWAVGEEKRWEELSQKLIDKAHQLLPDIENTFFPINGEAGRYFRHQKWIA